MKTANCTLDKKVSVLIWKIKDDKITLKFIGRINL